MAVGVEAILTGIRRTLLAMTPDVFPGAVVREAMGSGTLGEQPRQGNGAQREFRIYARPDAQDSWWNGSLAELQQTVVVELRYFMPAALGGEERARLMAGSDAARLTHQLVRNFDWQSAPELTSIRFIRAQNLIVLDADCYMIEVEYQATYFLGDDSTPPEISP